MSEKSLTQSTGGFQLQVSHTVTPESSLSYSIGSRYNQFSHLYTTNHTITNIFAGPSASPLPSQTECAFLGLNQQSLTLTVLAPTTYSGGQFTAESLSTLNINNA